MNEKLNPPFGWIGGKSKLRAELAKMIPEQDTPLNKRMIKRYVEVFGGAAWLLLYKKKWFADELIAKIKPLRERLQNVAISCEGFENCIKRWDHEAVLKILDFPLKIP